MHYLSGCVFADFCLGKGGQLLTIGASPLWASVHSVRFCSSKRAMRSVWTSFRFFIMAMRLKRISDLEYRSMRSCINGHTLSSQSALHRREHRFGLARFAYSSESGYIELPCFQSPSISGQPYLRAAAQLNRPWLQAIQLVEAILHVDIRNEVIDIIILFSSLGFFRNDRLWGREAVVHSPDVLAIADCQTWVTASPESRYTTAAMMNDFNSVHHLSSLQGSLL